MKPRAIYNEIDPVAAHVLRAMIADGHIAPGDVCERSIKELTADDLRGYNQIHLFAGGGLWSVAARLAGWRDEWPIWTASCPCQPFSQAGKGAGIDDPRHLWPDVDRLVREAHEGGFGPHIVVGEQVSGSAGADWFDGVSADLARQGYEVGARDVPACAVDGPHIRQRLYWAAVGSLAHSEQQGEWRRIICGCGCGCGCGDCQTCSRPASEFRGSDGDRKCEGVMGNSFQSRLEGQSRHGDREAGRSIEARPVAEADDGDLGNTDGTRQFQRGERSEGMQPTGRGWDLHTDGRDFLHADPDSGGRDGGQEASIRKKIGGATAQRDYARRNGSFWSDHEWIICHDGKARRTKSGIRNVADGISGRSGEDDIEGRGVVSEAPDYSLIVPPHKGRVNAWKITGNAIVPELAGQVLAALLDVIQPERAR